MMLSKRIALLVPALTIALALSACPKKKKEKTQIYFDDLSVPVGIKANVAKDISLNKAEGGESLIRVVVDPDLDRDDLDSIMKSFYRQTKDRGGFLGNKTVKKIDIRFYTSAAKATAEGTDWLASVQRTAPDAPAKLVNKQKLPLLKWAKKALGKMPQYTKEKPRILADPKALALEMTMPFVKDDGSGDPVDKMTFKRVARAFASLEMVLFDKIEQLKKMTLIGTYKGEQVCKIWLTRAQATELNIRKVEEGLGAFDGKLMNKLVSKQISDKKFAALKDKQRAKVYKKVFARLPKEQVVIDEKAFKAK
ncbi:MAG: hypothetical protein KAI47_21670 [Deltaproteobacteria bacterium]|nr:hypothetical protein [Deltaproteobacteria bacterium]